MTIREAREALERAIETYGGNMLEINGQADIDRYKAAIDAMIRACAEAALTLSDEDKEAEKITAEAADGSATKTMGEIVLGQVRRGHQQARAAILRDAGLE